MASGTVLAGVLAAAVWSRGPFLDVLVVVAVTIGAWEYAGLVRRLEAEPPVWLLYPLSVWLAVRFLLPSGVPSLELGLGVAVVVGLFGVVLARLTLLRWAAALAGALYLGFCLGYYLALASWQPHDGQFGSRLLTLLLLGIIAGDVIAYFLGSALGRHPFFSSLSPRKTVEGALGGLLGSLIATGLLAPALVGISWWQGILMGMLIAIAAQGGDLAESALKRQAEVKDSSRLIPGHGGLLDRLDSVLLVGPVVYCYLRLIALP
ncbi:MAG TPA: phosphatidate cytidylyltransferase [Candidatus Sulfotelmatobacter sp.]|nr:phosphatidate cytidylyltransferase [Candidatus Sulfotelmatobacter sp.]